jgi:hypothetical protein
LGRRKYIFFCGKVNKKYLYLLFRWDDAISNLTKIITFELDVQQHPILSVDKRDNPFDKIEDEW